MTISTDRDRKASLGYFQRVRDVPNLSRAPAAVRRITGGGAIYHAAELTFSISAPEGHALYAGPVPQSYARVHAAVIDALAQVGVHGNLRGAEALASDRAGTGTSIMFRRKPRAPRPLRRAISRNGFSKWLGTRPKRTAASVTPGKAIPRSCTSGPCSIASSWEHPAFTRIVRQIWRAGRADQGSQTWRHQSVGNYPAL